MRIITFSIECRSNYRQNYSHKRKEGIIVSRKGENIYKRKDGRWEGRYIKTRSRQGKAVYGYVYAKSYYDVKRKMSSMIANLENDKQLNILNSNIKFGALAEDWLRSVRPQVKESTYIKYRNMIQSYVLSEFRDATVDDMTPDYINNYCNLLLIKGGVHKNGLSPKTVSDILSLIRSVFRYAEIKGIRPPCTGKEIIIKQPSKKICILRRADQDCLCQYLFNHISGKNLGILLCLFTGIRIGEICALKWEDISFKEKTLYVHQTMQRIQVENDCGKKTAVTITAPKSSCSIRTIPIPENIIYIMENSFTIHRGYILTGRNDKYMEPRSLQNYFKRILMENSIEPVNFHALRHTFATRCVEVGFDVKSLSEILGHANVNITMNRYVHPSMELKKENMQRLSELFPVK